VGSAAGWQKLNGRLTFVDVELWDRTEHFHVSPVASSRKEGHDTIISYEKRANMQATSNIK
jgi:hypothetical protein